jgi:hypothetical protein
VAVPRKPAIASSNSKYARSWPTAIAYNMKSIASSIQPTFAAASTRHCSPVIVRYHGAAGTAAAVFVASGCTIVGKLARAGGNALALGLRRRESGRAAPILLG